MTVTPWAAPPTMQYGGKTYTRLLDLQDPSMVPAGWDGTLGDYAGYYGFNAPDQFYSLAALPPCAGVQDHQPRYLFGAGFTTQRNGVYWEPTDYTRRGPGPAQFMVPYEATDILVVYPFHEQPGADWEKGMDAFTYNPDNSVHEFSRPYPDELEPVSYLYFGDGVGVFHTFTQGENNWIFEDGKFSRVGAVRNGTILRITPPTTINGIEMRLDWEWFLDASHYDALVVAPMTLEPDNNFFVLEYNIFLPRSVQPGPGDPGRDAFDSFVRPFFYSAVGSSTSVPGSITVSGATSGISPSLPVH